MLSRPDIPLCELIDPKADSPLAAQMLPTITLLPVSRLTCLSKAQATGQEALSPAVKFANSSRG